MTPTKQEMLYSLIEVSSIELPQGEGGIGVSATTGTCAIAHIVRVDLRQRTILLPRGKFNLDNFLHIAKDICLRLPMSLNKVCRNCKFNSRWEDDWDVGSENGTGRRVGFRCSNSHSPVIHTVVERESNPDMHESDCYIHTFGCNLWESRES